MPSTRLPLLISLAFPIAGCLFEGGARSVSVSQLVSAEEGGMVCTPDDVAHVYLPPGALARDTRITIESREEAPGALADLRLLESGFDFGPDGTRFGVPVTVTLHPVLPGDVSIDQVSLVSLSSDGSVEELAGVYSDPFTGAVSGTTMHFSTFYAFVKGPAGGRSVRVGGDGLVPLFGTSTTAVRPPIVGLWIGPDGQIRTDAYSADYAETLVIQFDSAPGSVVAVDGWVVDPVDVDAVTGPTGDRIGTSGFWHDFLKGSVLRPLQDARPDAQGSLAVGISGQALQSQILQFAPAGYPSGRIRLRFTDAQGDVDIMIAMALSPYVQR